ncbi:myosin heavy chain kinase B-like isoform X2 [Hydra vulgaris]|uniref:Myosin heavy chain kinase B-like isoform X2 n=1 Tax=Hydra vulgaris TaxID=6087 RepID=A0ABM4BVR6_HYDVU
MNKTLLKNEEMIKSDSYEKKESEIKNQKLNAVTWHKETNLKYFINERKENPEEVEKSKEKKRKKKKERKSKLKEKGESDEINELKVSVTQVRKHSFGKANSDSTIKLPEKQSYENEKNIEGNNTARKLSKVNELNFSTSVKKLSLVKTQSDSNIELINLQNQFYNEHTYRQTKPEIIEKLKEGYSKRSQVEHDKPLNEDKVSNLRLSNESLNNKFENSIFHIEKLNINNEEKFDESDEEIKRAMSSTANTNPSSNQRKSTDRKADSAFSKRVISVIERSDFMRFFESNSPNISQSDKDRPSGDHSDINFDNESNNLNNITARSLDNKNEFNFEAFEMPSIVNEKVQILENEKLFEVESNENVKNSSKESDEECNDNISLTEDEKIQEPPEIQEPPPKPKWHPPWQLSQEIIAHTDAIPVLQIDPSNRWFATGSSDKTVRIWDINDGGQKLVINAHKQSIRAMTFGLAGHRQLFTTADDRQLLCHDIEVNRIVSQYKGQSAVIYAMCTYQPSQLLITAARDKVLKIYDTRSTKCIKTLRGHQNTVSCVIVNEQTKQIISGSHDGTLRLWDVGEGKCTGLLQGHSKSVRGVTTHPDGDKIVSASTERILAWNLPLGECFQEIIAENIAINSVTINHLGVTVAGGSNGVINIWDFKSGHMFQKINRTKVYESQEIPICVFTTKFDLTGTKLICSDACNVVKIYKEAYTKVSRRYRFRQASEFTDTHAPRTQSNTFL